MLITTELKDKVLSYFCDTCEIEHLNQLDLQDIYKRFSIDFDTLHIILNHFEDLGFIEDLNARYVAVFFILKFNAVEFIQDGGFQAEKAFSELQMQKLQLEVEKLKFEVNKLAKSNPEIAERVLSILANIATITYPFFK